MRTAVIGRVAAATAAGVLAAVAVPLPAGVARADEVRDAQWHVAQLDLVTAHGITRGEGVTVAVVDSGVDATHRDLQGALLPGVDLADPDNRNAWTPEEHGTLVAGVIGGRGHGPGRADGVLGVAPGARILPIRVATGDDPASAERVGDAIRRAAAEGAGVISISLSAEHSEVDERAVAAARRADAVVVAAAGNRPDAEGVTFPASLPTVVAVGGIGRDGGVADFSVTGPEIALTAPGDEIVTTSPGDEYAVASGTSLAAPMVAGVAALVRSRFPELTADEVIHRLVATAADSGPLGRDEQYGYGVVDPAAALTAEVPAMPPVANEPDEVRRAQWHLAALDLAAAHAVTRGAGVTVGLVGAGVHGRHPDLHRNVRPGVDLAEPEHDDAWTPTASGTALAGVIAGHGNRLTDRAPGNRGVLGVAPEAEVLPIRVTGPGLSDREAVALAAEGIQRAVAGGARVICYAGGRASQVGPFAGALAAAQAADVVVVAAAGDRDGDGPEEVWFPAADPAVVAVSAVGRDGGAATGVSVTGPEVTLAAPGVDIRTTAPADGYTEDSSTGLAAAAVAGAAALVRAAFPELTAEQVVHRLVATATDAGPPGRDPRYGHGVLDLAAVLTAEVPPPRPTPTGTGAPAPPGGADPPPAARDFGALPAVVLAVAAAAAVLGTVALVARRSRSSGQHPTAEPGPGTHPDSPLSE